MFDSPPATAAAVFPVLIVAVVVPVGICCILLLVVIFYRRNKNDKKLDPFTVDHLYGNNSLNMLHLFSGSQNTVDKSGSGSWLVPVVVA
jgi:hypothetical protein